MCGTLDDIREHLWCKKRWDARGLRDRMTYLACIWGFDKSARVSEYTAPEGEATDHCVRIDEVIFYTRTPTGTTGLTGSDMISSLRGVTEGGLELKRVTEYRVLAVTWKSKQVTKGKMVGRRSDSESRFLDDLIIFSLRSGGLGDDNFFRFCVGTAPKVSLTGFALRKEIKQACTRLGLPSKHFSSHSLRKGVVTKMRALGASEDDRRDRGKWAPGSQVMNNTYNYGIGLEPLAADSLPGGYWPSVTDIRLDVKPGKRGCGVLG